MKFRNILFVVVILALIFSEGVQAKPSSPVIDPITPVYLHIEDSNLFGSPEGFNVQAFLNSQPGPLKEYTEENQGYEVLAATAIDFYSQLYGIDPRVVLTLIEVKSNAITDPSTTDTQILTCMGNQDLNGTGFFAQLKWGLDTLLEYYDQALAPDFAGIISFLEGKDVHYPGIDPASFALNAFLALNQNYSVWLDLVGTDHHSYLSIYEAFFGSSAVEQAIDMNQITVLDGLRLPWGNGETWYYTGGPHTATAGGRGYAKGAIDFAPGGGSGCFNSGAWVRAARAGTVVYAGCNFVRIDHGGGWSSAYFHLSGIQVYLGQQVAAGTALGHPSCGVGASCGWTGRATGSHFHFDTRVNNQPQAIAGTSLDGWVVGAAAADYRGTLTLGNVVKNAAWWVKDNSNGITASAFDADTDDARTLTSGQTLYGRRDPGNDEDLYYFYLETGQTITINMVKSTDSFDPYLTLKKPDGQVIVVNDDGGEGLNARIVTTVDSSGRYQIIAKGWSTTTGNYSISATVAAVTDVEDGTWLSYNQTFSGKIDNNSDKDTFYFNGVAGRIVTISMSKVNNNLDSYLELYNPVGTKIIENDDGGVNWNSFISITLSNTGVYRIIARSWGLYSSGDYQIRLSSIEPQNYALNRNVFISSYENGSFTGGNAVDGRDDTRWSSQYLNNQYIYVDLGSVRQVNMVTLKWETAYASRYGVWTWDGSDWDCVYYTTQGNGGTDILNFTARNTRYVLVWGYDRGTPWGFSIWEFGVFDSNLTVMPIANPDDPFKVPDTVEDEDPPPATSMDKDDGVLALTMGFNGEQEFIPPLSTFSGETPTLGVTQAGQPNANIEVIHFDDTLAPNQLMLYHFHGSASDNDFEGAGEQIVAYEWTSNLDGVLSTALEFTKSSIDLSVGTHTISFRAQDNEGTWSEISTMELIVEHPAQVFRNYIPVLVK